MLIHNIKFKGFVVLPCETEVLTVLFLKIHASCDVTLCHWASNYQVLKASYPFKMLETTQGTTQHLTLMWRDSVSLGKQLPSSEGIISLQNVGNYARNDTASHPHVMWLCIIGRAVTIFWRHNNYLKLNERQSVTSQKMGIFVLAMLLPFNTYILYKMYANDPSYNKLHMPKIMVNLLSP